MLGTEAAIKGAAAVGSDGHTQWLLGGREVVVAIKPRGIATDKVVPLAMPGASLPKVNPPATIDNLRRHQLGTPLRHALGTEALRVA